MDRQQQITLVLSKIEQGELSAMQGVKALRSPPSQERRGRTWLPLLFRLAVVSQKKSIRLTIPLFIIGPLGLFLFIVFLPFAAVVVALVSIWKREALGYFTLGIKMLCSLTTTLLLYGRGVGVWVKDKGSEFGFWLS